MTDPNAGMLTRLLRKWSSGDKDAFGELMPLVQDELRRQVRGYFRAEPAGHTLQPTALVNEAYMRLVKQDRVNASSSTSRQRGVKSISEPHGR